jgi:hypothetical protein
MNLLFTGRGRAGSWKVRGEQLGHACGAAVTQAPTIQQCREADRIVVVKRTPEDVLATIRKSGTPWVYDIVDCYPQPGCTDWGKHEAIEWVQARLKKLAPSAVVWPNQRMRQDCDTGLPGFVLPHHYRPGIAINPIREQVRVVGYEGAKAYIESWRETIEYECRRRGWRFEVNPAQLADLDIVLAVRSAPWDCYVTQHWKSNVKLANAHGSGTPFIGQPEDGYRETQSGAEYWTKTAHGLGVCFEWLAPQDTRRQVSERFLRRAYTVQQAADDLMGFLGGN